MMETVNTVASIITSGASLYLLFTHYADKRSRLEEALYKVEYALGKIALIIISMGTFWSVVKIEALPNSQVLLNTGLALFMIWTCFRLNKIYYNKNIKQ